MRATISAVLVAASLLCGAGLPAPARSQPSDARGILRVVVPFPPGGAGDTVARAIAPALSEKLKQQVLIDNRPGANTILGAEIVAKATPDGNTVFLTTEATLAINPSLYGKLPYSAKDFIPITMVINAPLVLVASARVPTNSVAQTIELARKSPGIFSYASVGPGSPQQLCMELLLQMSGTTMNHIPYKGGSPAISDVAGGQVDYFFAAINTAAPFIASGRVKPLALSSSVRSATMPDLPTVAESGFPGYEAGAWLGLLGPAGMPDEAVKRLQTAVSELVNSPQFKDRWLALGFDPIGNTSAQFEQVIKRDSEKWSKLIREVGIKVE